MRIWKTTRKYEEILGIIKACQESGVSQILMEGLEVTFFKKYEKKACTCENTAVKFKESIPVEQAKSAEDTRQIVNQLRRKEDVMNELLITDPVAYEEMLVAGELSEPIEEEIDEDGEEA